MSAVGTERDDIVTSLFAGMMPKTNSRCCCRMPASVSVLSLCLLISLQSSSTLAATSSEASGRRPQQQQQRLDQHPGWTTTTARRRQPVPLDCSEGLQRCRGSLDCRTLLDTLDRVCDQSSTLTRIINRGKVYPLTLSPPIPLRLYTLPY